MYIEFEDGKYVIYNESGYAVAERKTEKDAERYKNELRNTRRNNNSRRADKVTYSMRSDD